MPTIPFQSLQCSVCFNDYDLEEHLPKILPICGHTICKRCLHNILINPDPKCPLDQKPFTLEPRNCEAFPINFSLRHLIEENMEWETCKIHGERIKLVCLTDKCRVCAYCVVYGGHPNHVIKSITDTKAIIDDKRKDLERTLKSLERYYYEIDATFDEARTSMLKIIEDRFRELSFVLKKKKLELSFGVEAFFAQHKAQVKSLIGKNSAIQAEILERISQYKDFRKINNLFGLLEEDTLSFTSKIDDNSQLVKHIAELRQKFKKEGMAVDKSLFDQIESFDSLKIPIESFIEELDAFYPKQKNQMIHKELIESTPELVSETRLKMKELNEKSLQITINREKSRSHLGTERWNRNVTSLSVVLNQFMLQEQDFEALELTLSHLTQLHEVHLNFGYQGNMSEDCFWRFLATVFWRVEALKTIEINYGRIKVGDDVMVLIAERILRKASNLHSLTLYLNATNVNDNGIYALSRIMTHSLKHLETFKLYLAETNVSEEAITLTFVSMPTLKNLVLGLGSTQITDLGLQCFVRNMLPSLSNLETFELGVWSTKVTDDGIICLFENLPNLKGLRLGFRTTGITDKSIDVLVREKSMEMTALRELEMVLDGTLVSEEMKQRLSNLKESLLSDKMIEL